MAGNSDQMCESRRVKPGEDNLEIVFGKLHAGEDGSPLSRRVREDDGGESEHLFHAPVR